MTSELPYQDTHQAALAVRDREIHRLRVSLAVIQTFLENPQMFGGLDRAVKFIQFALQVPPLESSVAEHVEELGNGHDDRGRGVEERGMENS
jgi:hypothetical protein